MLVVLPYARGRGFNSRCIDFYLMCEPIYVSLRLLLLLMDREIKLFLFQVYPVIVPQNTSQCVARMGAHIQVLV
jgi:hypothetical protein